MTAEESVRRFGGVFDLAAEAYDALRSSYPLSLLDRAIERGNLGAGSRVLEVGCGTAPTFFSSFPRETNTRLMREAGFEILRDELVTFREPDGDATFQWRRVRKFEL